MTLLRWPYGFISSPCQARSYGQAGWQVKEVENATKERG